MRQLALALAAFSLASCAATIREVVPFELTGEWAGGAIAAERDLARIARFEDDGPALAAVIAVNENAPAEAAAAMRAKLPLAGRTVLVKDNIETREWPTTAGSLALADNMTRRDAPLITKLRAAGGVVLGKTNLSEWANFRSSNSTSGWSAVGGETRNPHGAGRNPCGSSSGSGAAVAAGFAWAAIGTETDGSITCPASVNGVVGFKPTVGLVSRTHVVPISVSQDTAGAMARSVADAAMLLTAIAGSDAADPATAEADVDAIDFAAGLAMASLAGVRLGAVRNRVGEDPRLVALFDRALADLRAAGAEIVEVELPSEPAMREAEFAVLLYEFREGIDAYLAGSPADIAVRSLADLIAFNKAHADTELRWFGQDLFEQALKARDREVYLKARADARRLAGLTGVDRLFAAHDLDLLLAPTTAPAWLTDLVLGDRFDGSVGIGSFAAIAGTPHLSVPMGHVEGLPVGLSIIGPAWSDRAVLAAGAAYERARSAQLAPPPLAAPAAP